MKNVLEIDSVSKAFDQNRVLTDAYLKCETGEIIGLLGRNGTGKSTLLKILFGTQGAYSKFIRINGKVYEKPYLASTEVAYLSQDSFLLGHLRVEEAIKFYLGNKKLSLFWNDEIIGHLLKNKVNTLSGGEIRYLEIKLLLNLPVKFVLLDEPFNGIAPVVVEVLKAMIRDHAQDKGIILTDHDYQNVLNVATRYCLLYDGTIKSIENRDDLVRWGYLLRA